MGESTPSPAPSLPPATCPHCGVIDRPAIGPGVGPHVARAQCSHCGQFFQWLSKFPPAEREARRQRYRQEALEARPPSPAQLHLLQILGDPQPPPANMYEASERIEALKRGRIAS
jgi:hypothetical protein